MADSMLTDSDVTINLMKEQIGGEDVYFHSLNVTLLAMMVAKEMNAPKEVNFQMGMASMFHDIGKVSIPDRILRKTDPLSSPELSVLTMHCNYGVEIGQKMGLSSAALKVIMQHHEHVDGSGYPKGIKGNSINLLARIVAIINTFDNLCNPAKQSLAVTPHQVLSLMYAHKVDDSIRQRWPPSSTAWASTPPGPLWSCLTTAWAWWFRSTVQNR